MRVTSIEALASDWTPGLRWLVKTHNVEALTRLVEAGISGLSAALPDRNAPCGLPVVALDTSQIQIGDVVAVTPGQNFVQVLYRETDRHHTVFLTNRCNSNCVMCSQPPTKVDDSWLIDEACDLAAHIPPSPPVVGFTGGEPLLLGTDLRRVLDTFQVHHPTTEFDVLTNGRLFSDAHLATQVLQDLTAKVIWMVPIYGHADVLHDEIVRSEGAFDQTLDGLLTLQQFRQRVQLRTVLIKPVLSVLAELCAFIARNLPFVREVALMGCEPIGFALANPSVCRVDIAEWTDEISRAASILRAAGIPTVVMNVPLCALPEDLRGLARQSISDWKQVYAPECDACAAKKNCCGLFAWHKRGWRPSALRPIGTEIAA
jgi:His-Xaa-Ser system radical SAM maturase HxsC